MCIFFVQFKKMYYFCTMKIKMLYFTLLIACALVIAWLSADLHRTKKHLADAEELIEIQHEMINKLGSLDAVRATINVEVNNKATFGSIKSGDVEVIADQVIRYTRSKLLNTDTICSTISH